jgi:DNA-directed RNA polymerase specialized sigma24 family protein
MATGLNDETFARLLECLDRDRQRAGERYEDLRRTLVRFFEWRGAPFPEEHADETFDRVARRLAEGVDVKNIGAYCYSAARLILLETRKGPDARRMAIETVTVPTPPDSGDDAAEKEMRLACLEECLHELAPQSRALIVEYYGHGEYGQIDGRRKLAERLGIKGEALANRAQRVRDKLERCASACLAKKSPI